jgi:hypothetical protein
MTDETKTPKTPARPANRPPHSGAPARPDVAPPVKPDVQPPAKPPRATPLAPGGSRATHMSATLTLGEVTMTVDGPADQVMAILNAIMAGGGTAESVIASLRLVAGPQKKA